MIRKGASQCREKDMNVSGRRFKNSLFKTFEIFLTDKYTSANNFGSAKWFRKGSDTFCYTMTIPKQQQLLLRKNERHPMLATEVHLIYMRLDIISVYVCSNLRIFFLHFFRP